MRGFGLAYTRLAPDGRQDRFAPRRPLPSDWREDTPPESAEPLTITIRD